jgi:hypothetical protein
LLTAFGCNPDLPDSECAPACLERAKAAGVCARGDDGQSCLARVGFYTADGGRFGCLSRVRVTNPANNKSVVAMVLDMGPSCSVERKAKKAALDASGRVNQQLFGADQGISDRSLVHVVQVDSKTPLGPERSLANQLVSGPIAKSR